jgi:hypothetical protein
LFVSDCITAICVLMRRTEVKMGILCRYCKERKVKFSFNTFVFGSTHWLSASHSNRPLSNLM